MNADQVSYYAERARDYEKIYSRPERQAEIAEIKAWLADEFRGLDVFEVACGTGFWTQAISQSAKNIHATDINQPVIDMAKKKNFGPAKIEFSLLNVFDIEPGRYSHNACFGSCIWSHIPKQDFQFFIDGLMSVVEAGGKVILMDNIYVEGVSTPIASTDAYENTYQIRLLEDGSEWVVMKNFPGDLEIRTMLADVADNLEIRHFTNYWAARFNKKA